MKKLFPLLLALIFVACSRTIVASQPSPSGEYTARTEISGNEAGPTRRFCVKLLVFDVQKKREMEFQTGASDGQRWAIAWTPVNTLVLYSSDIGTLAYDVKSGKIIERKATAEETKIADEAYRMKYKKKS